MTEKTQKTLEELELDYKNSAEALHRLVVCGIWTEHTDRISEEYKRASDAYYDAKYPKIIKRGETK